MVMAKALPMQVVNLGQRQSAKTMGQMPAPPIAGFIPSPITGALIPVFLVELTHRGGFRMTLDAVASTV
jgi:hypothetical protein